MPTNRDDSDARMLHNLTQMLDMCIRQARETQAPDARRNALAAAREIYDDVVTNFDFEGAQAFARTYREALDQLALRTRSAAVDLPPAPVETRDSPNL